MRCVLYGLTIPMLAMVCLLSASEREIQGGGSARLPYRTISHAPGLISSASHDDLSAVLLQKQVASRGVPVTGEDSEDACSLSAHSSFAEPLTAEQQADHAFDFDIATIQRHELPKDATQTTLNKAALSERDEAYKNLARDIKRWIPLLIKIHATFKDKVDLSNYIAGELVHLSQIKYREYSSEEVVACINRYVREKQNQHCCVIL